MMGPDQGREGEGDAATRSAVPSVPARPSSQAGGAADARPGSLPTPDPSSRGFWVGLFVMVLSLVSGLSTYLILTNLTPIVPRNEVVFVVLALNIVLILAMIAVIAWQMVSLWRAWRGKVAGSRLHIRIVALFCIIAAIPALILAVAATLSFWRGLDTWFSSRPREIVQDSLQVARAYVEEHGRVIRADIVAMARDLDTASVEVRTDPRRFRDLLVGQAGLRDLAVALVIDANGEPMVRGTEDSSIAYEKPSATAIQQASEGQVPIGVSDDRKSVEALARLSSYPGFYLYVARAVSPRVLTYLRRTQAGVDEYEQIRRFRGRLTFVHGLMYVMTALTAVLAAIWTGFWFAGRFVAPIGRIIAAAQQVSRGNLKVELPVIRGEGDLRRLSQTFNTMTSELRSQRDALVSANEQLLERRQFMEAVLSAVSAGVLGLDTQGRITIANSSAQRLLGLEEGALVGRHIDDVVPEFGALLGNSPDEIKPRAQVETKLQIKGEERTFSVRLTHHGEPGAPATEQDAVLTFDDITELVSAQRTSAWGEVARRLAHEIKNPLTPIILSAERIRRKYGRVIIEDKETFDKLTATIERQAGDIKHMVDEFASFARIPKPVMELHDLRDAILDSVILFRESNPAVSYNLEQPPEPLMASFDRRLITQAMTNLVKNATEAVGAVTDAEPGWKPRVDVALRVLPDRIDIEVVDNGPGLPKQNRSRLLEPYVTTKGNKGTGLGLAIVQKIVEQHGGVLVLEDAPPAPGRARGALVRLSLPPSIRAAPTASKPAAAE